MRDEFQCETVKNLRNQNMSYTEIGDILWISRHIARNLYVYQRKVHRKKSGPKPVLDNKDKLAIKRRIAILKSVFK